MRSMSWVVSYHADPFGARDLRVFVFETPRCCDGGIDDERYQRRPWSRAERSSVRGCETPPSTARSSSASLILASYAPTTCITA